MCGTVLHLTVALLSRRPARPLWLALRSVLFSAVGLGRCSRECAVLNIMNSVLHLTVVWAPQWVKPQYHYLEHL